MKHMSHYSLFESNDDIKSTLKDISMDLTDNGFLVNISSILYDTITILIFKDRNKDYIQEMSNINGNRYMSMTDFNFSDVKTSLDHIISYMKSVGYIIPIVKNLTSIYYGLYSDDCPVRNFITNEELLNNTFEYKGKSDIKFLQIKFIKKK